MTENFTPPAHPGELLGEEIFRRGLNAARAAKLLGVAPVGVRRIINGIYNVTPEMAQRLELAGVGTAQSWLAQQAEYSLWKISVSVPLDVQPFPPLPAAQANEG